MSNDQLFYLKDFSLGINSKDSPSLLNDNELVEAENAMIGKGFVQKRHGFIPFAFAPVQQTLTWAELGPKKWSEV
jgi:hypothetical protein